MKACGHTSSHNGAALSYWKGTTKANKRRYPGSLGNYAGVYLGIPVVTLELAHAGIMPTSSQISNPWTDLVRWLIHNV